MSAIDDPKTLGRARLSFADQHDIDEFIATLTSSSAGSKARMSRNCIDDSPRSVWRCPMQGPSPTSRAARARSLASSR